MKIEPDKTGAGSSNFQLQRTLLDAYCDTPAYWVLVVGVMVLFLLACLQGVADFWVWGHDGFNGSAFAQAGRNSLRFGTFAMHREYWGLEPFALNTSYTHHPLSIHAHIIASYKMLGGYSAFAARLPTALYSWLIQVMLFIFVKRYYGKSIALISAIAYMLIPLNLIFANMISHQQGSLFWCLFYLYFYSRWRESRRGLFFVLVLFGVSMAIQYDWAAYYISFFTAVHVFAAGVKKGAPYWRWRPEFTFCAVFSVVVLANVGLFYIYIVGLYGGFAEMAAAFSQRTSDFPGYWLRIWDRSFDMYGAFYIALIPIWFVTHLIRSFRGQTHLGDQIPVFFLLAQIIHSNVFKGAGFFHAYWTYNVNPGLAVMVAIVLCGASSTIFAWFSRWEANRNRASSGRPSLRLIGAAAALVVFVVPFALQARFAWHQLVWGVTHGDAAYVEPYDDQYVDLNFARHLARRFDRTNADFLIHSSLDWRIEPLAYLDAPNRRVSRLRFPSFASTSDRHQILLVDLTRTTDLDQVGALLREHPAWVYDERFLAIDGTAPGEELTAFRSYAEAPSLWWKWFVSLKNPPLTWIEEQASPALIDLVEGDITTITTNSAGGHGGGRSVMRCPIGHVLSGLDVWVTTGGSTLVRGIRPVCNNPALVQAERTHFVANNWHGRWAGEAVGPASESFRCRKDQVVVGVHGRAGGFLDALGVDCGLLPAIATASEPISAVENLPAVGGEGGGVFELACPPDWFAVGLETKSGGLVDSISVICSAPDASVREVETDVTTPPAQSP